MATPGQWYTDRNPSTEAPLLQYHTVTRHLLVDSTHKREEDASYNYRVYFGVTKEDSTSIAERMKNIVSLNVISAEIPRTADNIIKGRNTFLLSYDSGAAMTVRLTPGLYLSQAAYLGEVGNALNELGVGTFPAALLLCVLN